MASKRRKFTKPSLSLDEQVALLERRGMEIGDKETAKKHLEHISYYRLRAYWLPQEVDAKALGDHSFKKGTTFENILRWYIFDRRLRLLVIDAIERVEVSIRASWAHSLAKRYGPHAYLEQGLYSKKDVHAFALASLYKDIRRSKETFVKHYLDTYSDPPEPPVWVISETLSLGQLSRWIANLSQRADRQDIAKAYKLDETILCSTMHHLTYIRNICAHHGRLWNKRFVVTMELPRHSIGVSFRTGANENRNIYNTLLMLKYLIKIIAPGSDWPSYVNELLREFKVDTQLMGFPAAMDSI